jgi:RHH-type proline utilization regulon transcriptional repressor/proline dehydrogenase/delta 1-pyrroline-5-carboxylate dehydrogenase
MATAAVEKRTQQLARKLAALSEGKRSRVYHTSWWNERVMDWAMASPRFKTQLFRFVDAFPATRGAADVVRHLREYFEEGGAPEPLGRALRVADRSRLGRAVVAELAERNVQRMGQQFIAGATAQEALEELGALWRSGSAATVDLLGEKTLTSAEAEQYVARAHEMLDVLLAGSHSWPASQRLERDDLGRLPRVNLSVKPTAVAPQLTPLTPEAGIAQAKASLRPLLKRAASEGAFVYFDMEGYDHKDLTLRLLRELLDEPELADLDAGVAVQAYLKDSERDLADLADWASRRRRPLGIRLVKGAYWDAETVVARAAGWPVPVFEDKAATDANFERCVDVLHEHHGTLRAAFGSHNVRSLAYAVASARQRGIADDGYEIQMLYGMAEPIQAAVRELGLRLRLYVPVGELVPGMAYLVRRLLENTANESFVRQRFVAGADLEELIAPPDASEIPGGEGRRRVPPTDAREPAAYDPEPNAEWRKAEVRQSQQRSVTAVGAELGYDVPGVIDGEAVSTSERIDSVDPGHIDRVVARSARCGVGEAEAAVAAARRAQPAWADTPARERAGVLFRTAEWMRARREELAALEMWEAGKPWREADADVCEAIDFAEYYGRHMLELASGKAVQSPPGERNAYHYLPHGIGVVISPWNFPLAIPTGMVTAGLVTGNAVLFKPAEQTPAIAGKLVEALAAAGLPRGVLAFLPGYGEEVGAHLVCHPEVAFVAFTGSKEAGLEINREAAVTRPGQRQVKRVVAEMGGKNVAVVDSDADLDEAVPGIVHSAFGYAGQKCSAASRVIALDSVYDELCERLIGATGELIIGHAAEMHTQVGPVIEAEAYKRLTNVTAADGGQRASLLASRPEVPSHGWYVAPTIIGDVDPASRLAREELFGPVLALMRASDFDEALELACDTDYALTAGVFSRSPARIRRAARQLRGGNVYINRGITGSVVGRQPFGGYGLSGVGFQAGGPDYLPQFLTSRVVTENTLRQGFAPLESR